LLCSRKRDRGTYRGNQREGRLSARTRRRRVFEENSLRGGGVVYRTTFSVEKKGKGGLEKGRKRVHFLSESRKGAPGNTNPLKEKEPKKKISDSRQGGVEQFPATRPLTCQEEVKGDAEKYYQGRDRATWVLFQGVPTKSKSGIETKREGSLNEPRLCTVGRRGRGTIQKGERRVCETHTAHYSHLEEEPHYGETEVTGAQSFPTGPY